MITSSSAIARPKKANTTSRATTTKKQPAKATQSNAKTLKAELKEWGKRKKALKPLQLKELIEENHKLRKQNQTLNTNVKELDGSIKGLESKLRETIKMELMREKANAAIRDLAELPEGSYTVDKATGQVFIGGILDERYGVDKETGIPFIKGILFKVQIGANKDLDLKEVLIDEVHHENLEQEKDNNLYKYTIGHFRNYWEANKLKKGLRAMGIKLAWIVPYKDGKRVLLKEVLPVVIEQKNKKKAK
ncbi:MAG: SPOR domain-containing protein [Candidatus Amoebophilus sp.]